MCYMEPNCVSINFGPSHGGKYTCELNSATDEDHLTVLEEKPTFTFLAIEVNSFMPERYFFAFKEICRLSLRNFVQGEGLEILKKPELAMKS